MVSSKLVPNGSRTINQFSKSELQISAPSAVSRSIQNLDSVLTIGNSAGTNNIDMNNRQVQNVARIGVALSSPTYQLHMGPVPSVNNVIFLEGSGTQPNQVKGIKNTGTVSVPVAPTSTSTQLEIGLAGWNGTVFNNSRRTGIRFITSENWTDTANGGAIMFDTVPNTTASNMPCMLLANDGTVFMKDFIGNTDVTSSYNSKMIVWGRGTTSAYTAQFHNSTGTSNSFVIQDNGNIGIGTATPSATSLVEMSSTTKGFRFPVMTTTQKNAIANSAGLVVFDTTLGKLCVNSGSGWQTITSV